MKIIGIIPARYESSRFPGKALADISGKPMIQRVYERSSGAESIDNLMVATDHQEIFDKVKGFGGNVVMTGKHHKNGTERCLEALENESEEYNYVINIQGDEPFIDPEQINLVASLLNGETEIASLCKKITNTKDLFNYNINKVIKNLNGEAIYFSRSALPYLRNVKEEEWVKHHDYYKHIGIYAYRSDILKEIVNLEPSKLEKAESLEQLRWIENGYTIKLAETEIDSIGVDTPEDIERLVTTYFHQR